MRLRTLAVGTAFAAVVLGDRMVCHPAPDGPAYAGGLGLKTPFGIIYSTNITPDPDTGIGRWTSAAFRRALREGVARDGQVVNPDGIASMDWSTYPILRFSGVPERIDVDLLDQPGLPFLGVAEAAQGPMAAALANALAAATGARRHDLPLLGRPFPA